MFPDPEAFNPLRWLKPEYPTYREPLTQYPTILNMTQFGYGRRTCQGQTVTEADLLVGVGSVAWLFDIRKDAPQPSRSDKRNSIMMNEKASISNEELNTGLIPELENSMDSPSLPGTFPSAERTEPVVSSPVKGEEEDPTLIFSTLLIAKPLPFKFWMRPRSQERAAHVLDEFQMENSKGEYVSERVYWEEGGKLGWGKV